MSGSSANNPINVPQDDGPRHQSQEEATLRAQGHNAFNSERPLGVQPIRTGRWKYPKSVTDLELTLRHLKVAFLVAVKMITTPPSVAIRLFCRQTTWAGSCCSATFSPFSSSTRLMAHFRCSETANFHYVVDKATGEIEKVKALRSWLFHCSDTTHDGT